MTTIAYKDGIMACDGRWTYNKSIDAGATKIRRLKSGALIGSAGENDSREIEDLFQNVMTGKGMPKASAINQIRTDYLGMIALPNGQVWKIAGVKAAIENWDKDFDEETGCWEVMAPCAIGSGADFAMAAMWCGKSAEAACKMASRGDPQTGWPFYSYHLKPLKRKRTR